MFYGMENSQIICVCVRNFGGKAKTIFLAFNGYARALHSNAFAPRNPNWVRLSITATKIHHVLPG